MLFLLHVSNQNVVSHSRPQSMSGNKKINEFVDIRLNKVLCPFLNETCRTSYNSQREKQMDAFSSLLSQRIAYDTRVQKMKILHTWFSHRQSSYLLEWHAAGKGVAIIFAIFTADVLFAISQYQTETKA
jgi:hypothetical protein